MQRSLKRGSQGPEVAELQKKLEAEKFLSPPQGGGPAVDGRYGPVTERAVLAFQRQRGLTPDGIVGARTAKLLGITLAPRQANPHAHAPDRILTATQREALADALDALIPLDPIPFVGSILELVDDAILERAIDAIDRLLASTLPDPLVAMLSDAAQGIETGDLSRLKMRLTQAANRRVNLPLMDEETEERVLGVVIGAVVDALRIGGTLVDTLRAVKTLH